MNEKELPALVSCIMPTYNRRRFVPFAINYFLRQSYINKELIIVDDGTDMIEDLVPANPMIKYFRLNKKITLGAKLNLACDYASGDIIVNWDDDDWYAKTRIQYQVESFENENVEVCGINNLLYYNLQSHLGYRYIYPPEQKKWLLGSSLCYKKKLWNRNRFADINVGMDGLFVWATSPNNVKVLSDSTMSVHMIHEHNISPKKTNNKWWHSYPVDELQKIMGEDWAFYKNVNEPVNKKNSAVNHSPILRENNKISSLKNIYACLVHESKESIADLVRNLRYHDPCSIILLYNGSNNSRLLENSSFLNESGAVIHPKPSCIKYGYLHTFAIECMVYALENLTFDSLTIVDSDQLAIRSGYSEYLGKFFNTKSDIGILSSNPERVDKTNVTNRVASQAFNEYDLWKPLLNNFKNGENQFVYWSFWPSTVFTKDAAKDLVKLFKENTQLQDIMRRTKIWASEEVILPTLVRLLGYEIALNPCSYNFVNYRKTYTLQNIDQALNQTDSYWIHPIERQYNNPLRKFIREHFNNYQHEDKKNVCTAISSEDSFLTSSILATINKIEGWLSDKEAELLITITKKVCNDLPPPHNIVEIGSYHGKSTVLFGSIAKEHFPQAKIYAIDPHDGKLGDADQGLQSFPPSFEKFKKNIEDTGLCESVEIIQDNSYNLVWKKPVSLLFIDGLHDYMNVSRDFNHFSPWLTAGGYVAFHDYATYFPGVKKLVDELLVSKTYQKTEKIESLIVLKKL